MTTPEDRKNFANAVIAAVAAAIPERPADVSAHVDAYSPTVVFRVYAVRFPRKKKIAEFRFEHGEIVLRPAVACIVAFLENYT